MAETALKAVAPKCGSRTWSRQRQRHWQKVEGNSNPFSTSLPRTAGSLLPLAQLPALSLQHFLDLVQHLHLLRRALAILGPVRRRDDDGFVGDHLRVVPAHWDVTVDGRELSAYNAFLLVEKSRLSSHAMYSHSLQRIVDRLSLLANTLAAVGRLLFQLCNARLLALFQTLGVDGRQLLLLLLRRCQGYGVETLDSRDGNHVVVAGVTSSGRARVDGNDIEDRAGGEEGTLEGLRLRRGGDELDAGDV